MSKPSKFAVEATLRLRHNKPLTETEMEAIIDASFKPLRKSHAELVDAVKAIEWATVRMVGGAHVPACPCCRQGNPNCFKSVTTGEPSVKGDWGPVTEEYAKEKLGHDKNCLLAKALKSAQSLND